MTERRSPKSLRLPMQMVNGQWELVYGGALPVREGAIAELVVNPDLIQDQYLRKLLTQEFSCRVLPEGTPLRVVLSDRAAGFRHSPDKFHIKVAAQYLTGEYRRFVPIWIGPYAGSNSDIDSGGLWMRQIGFERCELESSLIELPEEFEQIHAQSLDHAFTILSERHETHRLSHTGNVYDLVFYQESNEEWYPLSTLRDGVRERSERAFLAAAWRQIEEQMGWCHLPVERKKKG